MSRYIYIIQDITIGIILSVSNDKEKIIEYKTNFFKYNDNIVILEFPIDTLIGYLPKTAFVMKLTEK